MGKEVKTNAMRILDKNKIPYEIINYECDEFIDGLHTAEATGAPVEQSFKTLVMQGKSKQYYVFVLPIAEDDYSVMALDISEDLTLIRVDLPDKGLVPPLCYRIYITYNPLKDEAHYYTIEMTKEKDVRLLGGVTEDAKHVSYGNAPVEGAELQEIMNLAKNPGELTS